MVVTGLRVPCDRSGLWWKRHFRKVYFPRESDDLKMSYIKHGVKDETCTGSGDDHNTRGTSVRGYKWDPRDKGEDPGSLS